MTRNIVKDKMWDIERERKNTSDKEREREEEREKREEMKESGISLLL